MPRRTDAPAPHARAGFSLAEVLVALVILAVGLLALESLGVSAARLVAASQRHNAFVSNAAGVLERAVAQVRSGASVDTTAQAVSGGTVKVTSTTTTSASGRILTLLKAQATPSSSAQSFMRSDTVLLQAYVY